MKRTEKTKRFGIIILELVFLIVILVGIVKLRANANSGPDLIRMEWESDLSEKSLEINLNQIPDASSMEFQRRIISSPLKEINSEPLMRNLLSQIPRHGKFGISDMLFRDIATKIDRDQLKLEQTGSGSDVIKPPLKLSEADFKTFNEYEDSIPKIWDPVYHRYLSPQILLSIGKR